MNATRWRLLLCCLPLIAIAQWCLNWRDINLNDVAISDTGRVFGVVAVQHFYHTELWEWSEDLSKCEVVFRPRNRLWGVASNDDGSIVALFGNDSLTAYDTARRQVLWRESSDTKDWATTDLFFAAGDRHIVVIDNAGMAWRQNRRALDQINVIDAKSGVFVGQHKANSEIRTVFSSSNEIRYVTLQGDVVTLSVIEGQLLETNRSSGSEQARIDDNGSGQWERHDVQGTERSVDSPVPVSSSNSTTQVEGFKRRWDSAATIRLTDHASGQTIKHRLSVPYGIAIAVLVGVSLAATVWVWILIRDSAACRWRVWLDFGIVLVLFLLMCVNVSPWDESEEPYRILKLLALCSPIVVCLFFLATLLVRRPLYFWSLLYTGCIFPFLLPTMLLGMMLRTCKIRIHGNGRVIGTKERLQEPTTPRQIRFGIRQMMLATAAAAIFIGVGSQAMFLLWIGVTLAPLVMVALLLAIPQRLAVVICLTCVFAIVMLSCGDAMLGSQNPEAIGLLMIPFAICFAGTYGYTIKRLRRDAKPRATTALGPQQIP